MWAFREGSCLPTGKVTIEEEMKEEMKEDMDPHNGADDGKCVASPSLHRVPGDTAPVPGKAFPQGAAQVLSLNF